MALPVADQGTATTIACATLREHKCYNPVLPQVEPLDIFSIRDLRTRSSDLVKDAELGQPAIITKRGRPAILAVPFDRRLIDQGIHRALALTLFEQQRITLAQASKLAGLALDEFIDLLGRAGLPAVDYPPEELAEEMDTAL
ncbi:type II toxin-antitoxin system prevent-host-death family antitoxin [Halochromatium glycolicum]|uniref:type II toxin-antitoxin system prevent-host-death family antitoxin n=1 Tax=Halochromatium glycolicum TaxID=85075 RepID=UPI001F5B2058|nr:type II toxin-antitoxin system prevent-host-death family antitoxin [Halochromatium glycolicum]